MSRGIRPVMSAPFEAILPEHGDLGEYLQAAATHNRNNAAQHSEDAEQSQLNNALLLSLIEAHVASQSSPATGQNYLSWNLSVSYMQNDSFDLLALDAALELEAALALSLEEEEPRASLSLSAAGNLSLNYTQNDSFDLSELDAALALSLEEAEEEPRANPSLSAAGNVSFNYPQNDSLDLSGLDATLALTLEEEEEPRANPSLSAAAGNLSLNYTQNDIVDLSELDAALALSLEQEEEPRANLSLSAAGNFFRNFRRYHRLELERDAEIALSLEEQAEEGEDDDEEEEEEPRANPSLSAAGNFLWNFRQNNRLELERDVEIALSLEEQAEEGEDDDDEVEVEPRANPSLSGAGNRWLNFRRELDADIALYLEEEEEDDDEEEEFTAQSSISAYDERGATPASISVPVTAEDDIGPDDMTFEQLQSPGETVGSESRGLSKELFDSFPVQKLVTKSGWFSSSKTDPEGCPICITEYEVGSILLTLPCLHMYHKSCIREWLKHNKTCPLCNKDMSVPQA